jgi:TetR/AcrR family transcriptional regulator, transcriptional repressor for nem operon
VTGVVAARSNEVGTAMRILDVAEQLVQVRGFNAFSYADVAAELKISKPALHYHFAGKGELGEALIARYSEHFRLALVDLDTNVTTPADKLAGYAALYRGVLQRHRMCLCGMLAADYQTLPAPMQALVIGFFDFNESWLASVLDQGAADGTLRFDGPSRDVARMIIGGLEGAVLVARPYDDVSRFDAAAANLLGALTRTV